MLCFRRFLSSIFPGWTFKLDFFTAFVWLFHFPLFYKVSILITYIGNCIIWFSSRVPANRLLLEVSTFSKQPFILPLLFLLGFPFNLMKLTYFELSFRLTYHVNYTTEGVMKFYCYCPMLLLVLAADEKHFSTISKQDSCLRWQRGWDVKYPRKTFQWSWDFLLLPPSLNH